MPEEGEGKVPASAEVGEGQVEEGEVPPAPAEMGEGEAGEVAPAPVELGEEGPAPAELEPVEVKDWMDGTHLQEPAEHNRHQGCPYE